MSHLQYHLPAKQYRTETHLGRMFQATHLPPHPPRDLWDVFSNARVARSDGSWERGGSSPRECWWYMAKSDKWWTVVLVLTLLNNHGLVGMKWDIIYHIMGKWWGTMYNNLLGLWKKRRGSQIKATCMGKMINLETEGCCRFTQTYSASVPTSLYNNPPKRSTTKWSPRKLNCVRVYLFQASSVPLPKTQHLASSCMHFDG